ncbi:MAG TPA: ABC transporter permease/substrate-binding protein [Myxococcota bacterium]|nr:ABC transporter permease/substrate-binding protein [Myxococcota bacterium]
MTALRQQLALLPGYAIAHLQLSLVALAIGIGVSIPLGIALARRPRLEPGALGVASALQTIPSLALLAIAVPLLAAAGALLARFGIPLRGIGYLPALLALSIYSVLPILRNTVAGLHGVDPSVIEAARAVGMTRRQRLLRVELPLALPVIVAGVRTSAVWVVGTATLSTPVGATSLGNFIFSGLATRNDTAVLVGCVASAALALGLDASIRLLERGLRTRRAAPIAAASAALALLAIATAVSFGFSRGDRAREVAIGSKVFTEQYVLAELLARRVAAAGFTPRLVPSLGSTVGFDALRGGEIDLFVDYTGTLWANVMHRDVLPPRREAMLAEVTRYLADEHGVRVVCALGFENTYALAMREDDARARGIARISDLARVAPELALGSDYEFLQRPEWLALRDRYGLRFREERSMDPALMVQAIAQDQVDVISAFSTDGRIAANRLVVLEDDRGVIPPYDAILLASPRLARERPELIQSLSKLDHAIDADTMRRANLEVDAGGRSPAEVAREMDAALR